jgi:hypothetical protein
MMVMTARVDMKKVILTLAAVVLVIIALSVLFRGGEDTALTAAGAVASNDERVQFLTDLGWNVSTSPVESSQVRIPGEATEVFERYNALQKSQGYDLSKFAGKTAMRYVYKVDTASDTAEPVYATLLIYKNQVIGGDITDTAANGTMQALRKATATTP